MTTENNTNNKQSKTAIKQLIVSTVLYLPLCFFIWFYASGLLVIPVKYLLQMILSFWQADLFNTVVQNQHLLTIETLIFPSISLPGQGDKLAVLDVEVNPMIYGYGIAVISGLILSMPVLKTSKKIVQIIMGYCLVVLIQTMGVFWELLKHLLFEAGIDAQKAILETGLSVDIKGLMYQLSYLILPAVVPIAYWIIINNSFIGEITGLNSIIDRNFEAQQVSDKQDKEN